MFLYKWNEWKQSIDSIVKFVVSVHLDLFDSNLAVWNAYKADYAQSLILHEAYRSQGT